MGRPMPFRNPAGYRGLRENLSALVVSLVEFFQSRLQLAAVESKAALRRLIVLVACAMGAGMLSLFGYLFLLAFAVRGIAYLLAVWWIWIALAAAVLHFGVALLCLLIAWAQLKGPLFHETTSVLKEDSQWLKNLDHNRTR